jgi:hypothetical protein
MNLSRVVWGGLLPLALSTLGCQWASDLIPTGGTPAPSPTPVAPLTIPVILPKPSPTPTPAPTPAPSPSPTPGQGNCSVPASNPEHYFCEAETIQFLDELDASITAVTQQNPELFDFQKANCEGCYYVKDGDRYHQEVGRQLGLRGLCSYYDGEEIGIKNSNAFNEQYDILLAAGYMRRGRGTYMGTCRPAWF